MIAEHLLVLALRTLCVCCGTTGVAIGATQVMRTLALGSRATNADDVIRRGGITLGVGAAFLFAGFAR